jgi:hypothetical protein
MEQASSELVQLGAPKIKLFEPTFLENFSRLEVPQVFRFYQSWGVTN